MNDEVITLKTLREANTARQKLWDTDSRITIEYRAMEMAGEAGEACNAIKKLVRERLGIKGSRTTLEDVAEELADICICVDLLAMDLGLDMEKAVAMKFNKTSEKVGLPVRLEVHPS